MQRLLKSVYDSKGLKTVLFAISYISTALSILGFALLSIHFIKLSLLSFAKLALALGVPFLLVSRVRVFIDAKRPYEVYDFYKIEPKGKKGHSFPSRHAFSAFAIATLTLFVYPAFASVLLLFAVGMCVCRVLLGIHFIRDVVAGGLVGVICSLLGGFILVL